MTSIERTFTALGDTTRLAIVEKLAMNETSLSDLAQPFSMSQTAVTKHVKILSEAGLVEVRKRGRTRYCRLRPEPLKQAEQWLGTYQQFWASNFDALSSYLDKENK